MISPSEHLSELVRNSDTSLSIGEGALVIARHEYPALDVPAYLAELDGIAARIRRRLPADAGKPHILSLINHCLFRELGYVGNRDNYYDPRNSFLNDVIDRRTGIPITLCILYMEVGKRLGLPLEGVAFPRHFTKKCPGNATPSNGKPRRLPTSIYKMHKVMGIPVRRSITSFKKLLRGS